MRALYEFTLLLAQAQAATPTPTPDAVAVTLVDEGKEWWEPYVVPTATLVAALVVGGGGVLLGGTMNRNTMVAVEADRADREDKRAAAKAERDLVAERRVALGSLRLLMDQLHRANSLLGREIDAEGDDPLIAPSIDTEIRFRPEDEHAIAMWVSDDVWRMISKALDQVGRMNANRARGQQRIDRGEWFDAEVYRTLARVAVKRVSATLERLEPELRRLASDAPLVTPPTATAPA